MLIILSISEVEHYKIPSGLISCLFFPSYIKNLVISNFNNGKERFELLLYLFSILLFFNYIINYISLHKK